MTNEKRALSWQEFLDSGFDGRDYNFPDFEGTFEAEMVCKRWDKNSKLLVYLDFDDGERSSLPHGRTPTIRGLRIFLLIPASELLSSIPRRAFLILEVPK